MRFAMHHRARPLQLFNAKKVLGTGESDLVILDEILGVLDEGIVSEQDILSALEGRSISTNVILTGLTITQGIIEIADNVYNIKPEK